MSVRAILAAARSNAVLVVSALAAAVTCAIVPPDREYAAYVDWNTLGCLFCMLSIIVVVRASGLFDALARRLVARCRNLRALVGALVFLTGVSSMFVTNDTALLMFLPLSALVLSATGNAKWTPFAFVMQDVAANLAGMIMPFGNPQNIFLYSSFGISAGDFFATMFPPFALSCALIAACCVVFVPRGEASVPEGSVVVDRRKAAVAAALFALAMLAVFRAVPAFWAVAACAVVLAVADRSSFARVDWGLLLTFACFFVFSGNMARIPAVQDVLGPLMQQAPLVTSALASQVVSNVPAAVLLSPFTGDWASLLTGVNVGGAGTPIASLASLITLSQFQRAREGSSQAVREQMGTTGSYLACFSAVNFAFLAILLAFCVLV